MDNPVISPEKRTEIDSFLAKKHPGTICVANYKGGVGKTTIVCLLGYYLAEMTGKKVLLFDIDPQCSLSLAVGFDPEEVSKTELTIYNLVKPSKWTKIKRLILITMFFLSPIALALKTSILSAVLLKWKILILKLQKALLRISAELTNFSSIANKC